MAKENNKEDGRSKSRRDQKNELKELSKALRESNKEQEQIDKLDEIRKALDGISSQNLGDRSLSEVRATFERANNILLNQNQYTEAEIQLAQDTLQAIQESAKVEKDNAEKLLAAQKEAASEALKAQFASANELLNAFEGFNQAESIEDQISRVTAQLETLGGEFVSGQNFDEVSAELARATEVLRNIESSDEEKQQAQGIIDAIGKNAQSEEERREAAKVLAKQNSLMGRMAAGIEAQKQAYDDFVGSAAGGGLIAALGAAAILFTDPETIMSGIMTAINAVLDTIDVIEKFISGDFAGGFEALGENLDSVSGVVLTAGLVIFRKVIIGALITGFKALFTTIGTAIWPAISTLGTTILGAISAPIIGLGVLIANAFYALWEGVTAGFDVYKETGSIAAALTEGVTTFAANFFGFIPDLLKGAVSWVAGALGFEEVEKFLDSFSFVTGIKDLFNNLGGMIGGFIFDTVESITSFDYMGFIREIPSKLFSLISAPVNLIRTAIDKILSFMEIKLPSSFDEIPQFLLSVVTAPITALKNAVSWILSKFGFEEESEAVEDFSFSELIMKMVNKAIDTVTGIFTFLGNALDSVEFPSFGDIMSKINDFIKSILRSILPDPKAPLLSIQGIASKAIPDAVYEYAGINPETGRVYSQYKNNNSSEGIVTRSNTNDTGAEIDSKSVEVQTAKEEAQVNTQTAVNVVSQGGTSMSTSTVNYSGGGRDRGRAARYNTANQ